MSTTKIIRIDGQFEIIGIYIDNVLTGTIRKRIFTQH